MTNLPPYFESSKESQKWEDGFKAGLKENVSEISEILVTTTDDQTAKQLENLLAKIERRVA
jgi:ABC-type sugar transport system substrate-binding protein